MLPAVAVALPAYEMMSFNQAGGYYNSFLQMLSELPVHQEDIDRRDATRGNAHRVGLKHERDHGIYRCVNGLEMSVPFLLVAALSALAGCVVDWRSTLPLQAALVVLLNLSIAFAWCGLPHQWPEALWVLDDGMLRPMREHPVPSY